jgi:membrane associated rhomboid family serine protease
MIDTPVGMRCPECAGGPRGTQRVVAAARAGVPYATYTLLAANVLVFLIQVAQGSPLLGLDASGTLYQNGALFGPLVAEGDWYRLFSSAFLHAGIIHLGFNMFVLYVLGQFLEPAIGTPRFVLIYLAGLVGGAFGALLLDPEVPTVGASGAIFGLMAATFVIARHRGLDQIASQIGLWIGINLLFSFSVSNISLGGHVGGLIAGGLAALVVAAGERQRETVRMPLEIAGMSAVTAIAIAGALLFAETI